MKKGTKRKLAAASAMMVLCALAAVLLAGQALMAPCNHSVNIPDDLHCETVHFQSKSGSRLTGSFIQGRPGAGVVIVMHGVRGNRGECAEHARFLSKQGYSVLIFDFQAHGESPGSRITFGYLESRDAEAAVQFVRQRLPGERLGIIGVSLGGAAAILAEPPLRVDGLVVEMAYSNIKTAVANRIAIVLGNWGRVFTPLLTCQLKPFVGVGPSYFSPLDKVSQIRCPKLIIGGSDDRHTTMAETTTLFEAAREPKKLWIVDGAIHQNLHAFRKEDYERTIGNFLKTCLNQ